MNNTIKQHIDTLTIEETFAMLSELKTEIKTNLLNIFDYKEELHYLNQHVHNLIFKR